MAEASNNTQREVSYSKSDDELEYDRRRIVTDLDDDSRCAEDPEVCNIEDDTYDVAAGDPDDMSEATVVSTSAGSTISNSNGGTNSTGNDALLDSYNPMYKCILNSIIESETVYVDCLYTLYQVSLSRFNI